MSEQQPTLTDESPEVPQRRVLIQSVGTGGPHNPVWDGMSHVIDQVRPDLVVWFCSEQTQRETLPKIRAKLSEQGWQPTTDREIVVADPDHLEELYREFTELIDSLRAEFPQVAIDVDYTSGTKAMSSAAAMAAVSRDVDHAHYAVGPRDATGRATRTNRVVSLDLSGPVLDHKLRELGAMFDRGEFTAVAEAIDNILPRCSAGKFQDRLKSLRRLSTVYASWDRFQWKQARGTIQSCHRNSGFKAAGWDCGALEQQEAFLETCRQSPRSAQRVVDLWANAERLIQRERFDDAVLRCYRLVEYILQIRFGDVFQIDKLNSTEKVPVEVLQDGCPQLLQTLETRGRLNSRDQVSLGLAETIYALAESGDPFGRAAFANYWGEGFSESPGDPNGRLKNKLDIRNDSFLAHGASPVSDSPARELLGAVRQLAQQHLETAGVEFDTLLETARFVRCPWSPDANG